MEGIVLLISGFFTDYGLVLGVLAVASILVLGILKFFKVFDKIPDDYRKYVYMGVATVLCAVSSLIYLTATDSFNWTVFGTLTGAVWGANQLMYSAYESYGVRALVKKIGTYIVTLVANDKIKEYLNSLIADEETTEPEVEAEAETKI